MKSIEFRYSKANFYQEFLGYDVYKVSVDGRNLERADGMNVLAFACCVPKHGLIILYDEFFKLPIECQKIVLLHEICHLKDDFASEDECDKFAADHLENGEYWLKEARRIMKYYTPILRTKFDTVR